MTMLLSSKQARRINALSDQLTLNVQSEITEDPTQTSRLYIECEEMRKQALIEGLSCVIEQEKLDYSSIGGLSVSLNKGWWRLRISYNHSAIVARCAGDNLMSCLEAVEHLRCRLLSFGLKLPTQPNYLWR